eukprot:6465926-Amphidinium_carterae.2
MSKQNALPTKRHDSRSCAVLTRHTCLSGVRLVLRARPNDAMDNSGACGGTASSNVNASQHGHACTLACSCALVCRYTVVCIACAPGFAITGNAICTHARREVNDRRPRS